MKKHIIFDCDRLTNQKYGIAYAVLEQMAALQKLTGTVSNFVVGWKHLQEHQNIMRKLKIPCQTSHFPKKIQFLLNENKLLDKYDYFYQIGLHAFRKIPREKYIIAEHDTVSFRYPQSEAKTPFYAKKLLHYAGKIVTVSNFSKNELCLFYGLNPNKIHVIPNGCNFSRFNLKKSNQLFQKVQKKYTLPINYCLAYGGSSPRKNLERLCKVFETMQIPLVIFGGYKYSGSATNIKTLGYLPEGEADQIIKNADMFIMSSYYEGFGLPILEAMACGIPVACANTSALPEVSGGNAVLFDPFSSKDMRKNIEALYNDKKLQNKLISAGINWSKEFSWEASAKKLLDLCND